MPSDDVIDDTIKFWSPRYGREITREEARQMIFNITAYAELLLKWAHEKNEAVKRVGLEKDSPVGAHPSPGIVTDQATLSSAAGDLNSV